ncbi:HTH-type transcriptional regulator PrtR [Sporomusa ovata DSM 2662]|uniref:helix-turn-helix domain-containing protein n=1 Tax=Sporomusa ovata TaxID=2378 RepID=UPI000388416D|nr:helix-turn-helix transcriptional regulator [Sporomusa ovata]EQB26955.1 putative helix-turn-helix domain containing protein [Sporomusa ovata DSM 2662]
MIDGKEKYHYTEYKMGNGCIQLNVGIRIKQRRELLNLSQEQLSQISGVSQSSIHYIESGENSPTAKTLFKLTSALGVSITELLGDQTATSKSRFSVNESQGGKA